MLSDASLYNRQILSTALIGTTSTNLDSQSNLMKAADIRWEEHELTTYDASVTEFDRGMGFPDYSKGSITVRFGSPINDTNFDLLLQQIGTDSLR